MKRVFVGLSGGVDSAVTAALLQRDGHAVTAVYMKNWTQDLPGAICPWRSELQDSRAVAAHLGIELRVYDFERQYRDRVVSYMIDEYTAGRTPNPDIMCNQEIKFKLFAETAFADGADMIATGHYAQVVDGELWMAVDENKDQTYFLYRADSAIWQRVLLPIGRYRKSEVRRLAKELGLPNATKPDSQGICFVGQVGIKAFLQQYVAAEPGEIVDMNGEVIGTHDGAIFYTIGQRSGLGVGGPDGPYFVAGKDMATNRLVVTNDPSDLLVGNGAVRLADPHWLTGPSSPRQPLLARFRHRGELIPARYNQDGLKLQRPVSAIAAGQSVVLYAEGRVVGGGIIAAAPTSVSSRAYAEQSAGA